MASVSLLERASALDTIQRLVQRATAGDGGILVVRGEAGIGKTVLLDAVREQAAASGALTLTACGGELEGSVYWIGVLAGYLAADRHDLADALLDAVVARAHRAGSRSGVAGAWAMRGRAAHVRGDVRLVEECVRTAREAARAVADGSVPRGLPPVPGPVASGPDRRGGGGARCVRSPGRRARARRTRPHVPGRAPAAPQRW